MTKTEKRDQGDGVRVMRLAPPEVMDIAQCARYLGISHDTLYNYAAQGTIPAFKLGNRWRFHKPLVDKWIAGQSEKQGSQ